MSTRANIIVADEDDVIILYRHDDGYPDGEHGVIKTLEKALKLSWSPPRFEAPEFAAAIVAAWKNSPGGIRIDGGYQKDVATENDERWKSYLHGDIDYYYFIEKIDDHLVVKTYDGDDSLLIRTDNLW